MLTASQPLIASRPKLTARPSASKCNGTRHTHANAVLPLLGHCKRVGSAQRALCHAAAATDEVVTSHPQVAQLAAQLNAATNPKDRLRQLVEYARDLPAFPEQDRVPGNRVMGCTAQVWLTAALDDAGRVHLAADSDSELSKGLAAVLVRSVSGLTPAQLLELDPMDFFSGLGAALGKAVLAQGGRSAASLPNMLETAKRRVRGLAGGSDLPQFPSLLLTADAIEPQGAFAQAQAEFLRPADAEVDRLVELLSTKQVGVVAHFYMDPQVQGVLTSAAERWPHVAISDSLVMADKAVKMAEAGCKAIAVLGVDFMSENVQAILDEAGHTDVKVYRMDPAAIGCSLAEAAESASYEAYLGEAGSTPASLHVVYINTSLRTKAGAHAVVPTITCTSSNVVQTVLTAFAQVPGLTVWYGPDTYMGQNLAALFSSLSTMSDEEVQQVHPAHTQASIKQLLPRLRYFQDGTCIVHHLFGGETVDLVRQGYGDAYLTAHFEVPGEMFSLAMEAKQRGRGVVGSTQNILDFIVARLKEAIANPIPERLQFVLGTETGMVTSIVRAVQRLLREAGRMDIQVEIVFPVSPEAITTEAQQTGAGSVALPDGLAVLPGPAAGEGCSMEGGCASCPYMKMNSLSALMTVLTRFGEPAGEATLEAYKPKAYQEQIQGMSVAQAGCVPILHMRDFQRDGRISEALLQDITSRFK